MNPYYINEKILILNREKIDGGKFLTNGKIYNVKKTHLGGFFVEADNGYELFIASFECLYFSRLLN